MNKRYGSWILVPFALATTAFGPHDCNHGKPRTERKVQQATGVSTAAADSIVPGRIVAPGIVEAWDGEIRLSAQESGWISKLVVVEGQIVKAGEILGQLDDEIQSNALAQTKAEVAEAEAQLTKIMAGATAEELQQAKAEYEAAATKASFADTEGTRALRLHEQGVITQADMDRATSTARAEAAVALAAAARKGTVQNGARAEDRVIVRQRLAEARQRLKQAETALARRQILAPMAGTILVSRFHVGEFFAVGNAPLFSLGDLSRFRVRLEVDEIDSSRVLVGAPCSIFSDDGRKLSEGRVFRAAPKMGRRMLTSETPTERNDIRIREVFIEVPGSAPIIPGQRVWGHTGQT